MSRQVLADYGEIKLVVDSEDEGDYRLVSGTQSVRLPLDLLRSAVGIAADHYARLRSV